MKNNLAWPYLDSAIAVSLLLLLLNNNNEYYMLKHPKLKMKKHENKFPKIMTVMMINHQEKKTQNRLNFRCCQMDLKS